MKSTEGKDFEDIISTFFIWHPSGNQRGNPPSRKNKNQVKASVASEVENRKTILDFFSPPRSNVNLTAESKRSGSTPRRRKNPLANLQSDLSPRFTTPTSSEKRRSRYRLSLNKSADDASPYCRSNGTLIGCVRRTNPFVRLGSPFSSPEVPKRISSFESPIDKLLRKNGSNKSLNDSLGQEVTSPEDVFIQEEERIESAHKKKLNCCVRIEQMSQELVANSVPNSKKQEETDNNQLVENNNNTEVNTEPSSLESAHLEIKLGENNEDANVITVVVEEDFETSDDEDADVIIIKSPIEQSDEVEGSQTVEKSNSLVPDLKSHDTQRIIEEGTSEDNSSTEQDEKISLEEEEIAYTCVENISTKCLEKDTNTNYGNVEIIPGSKNTKTNIENSAPIELEVLADKMVPKIAVELQTTALDKAKDALESSNNKESKIKPTEVVLPNHPILQLQESKMQNDDLTSPEDNGPIIKEEDKLKLKKQDLTSQENNESITNDVEMVIENNTVLQLQELKLENEELSSIKSPSTFSVDSAKGSSLDNDLNWVSIETGDLFWGQIFQFSYWPCMVCPDPEGKTISVNENRGQMQHVMIHVRFFADNGRRSWVKRDNLMVYTDLETYMKKKQEAQQKYSSKSLKYRVFCVSGPKQKLWNQAIKEADLIYSVPIEDRLEKFFELLEEVKVLNAIERKRRQSCMLSSTSDISSMFGSSDNLYIKQNHSKRQRSPTPVSPAFSPLGPSHSEKRIKLENHNTSRSSLMDLSELNDSMRSNESTACIELERVQNTESIFKDIEFKNFAAAMRSFVFDDSTDHKLEKQFQMNLRSMWAMKHITFRNRFGKGVPNGVKRLSQRIRNISIQKSLPSTPIQDREVTSENRKSIEAKPTPKTRPIDEVIDDIFELDNKYLFKDLTKNILCNECYKPGPSLVKCSNNCNSWVHIACSANFHEKTVSILNDVPPTQPFLHITGDLDDTSLLKESQQQEDTTKYICQKCHSGETTKCFVCKYDEGSGELARCNSQQCGKFYHLRCLRYWPQAKITKSVGKLESLRCPVHVCHTCISDDPKGKFLQIEKSKLTKCVKCPATYHMDSTCIPAGSQLLSASMIICPRHCKEPEAPINVNWCFICVAGGKLICCETCPTAVHAECLKIPVEEEGYICEECETGRMPLYGEMVWAKFRSFRWWPSLILPPTEVPVNLSRKAHRPSEFVIRFFGTNDHAWISRRRVYLYQEGDCSEPPKNQKKVGLDMNYNRGVEEAKRIAELIKQKKMLTRPNEKKQRVSPLPYVKIKSNRAVPPIRLQVDMEKINKCDCDKDSENPCSQDSGCINRVLFNECNPKICPAGDRCQNQLFEKKMYPKVDVVYMNAKGFGLICLEPISAGTFVIEYVGEVIDDAEFRRRISQKEQERDENFYFLTLEKDYIIDAGPKGNMARFMNHSCEPNCETQKWSVNGLNRIGLFAIKDIPKGSELTFNYFWDELLGNEKKNCHCGAPKCAGVIGGKYKEPKEHTNESLPKKKSNKKKIMTKTKTKMRSPKKGRKSKAKEIASKPGKKKSNLVMHKTESNKIVKPLSTTFTEKGSPTSLKSVEVRSNSKSPPSNKLPPVNLATTNSIES